MQGICRRVPTAVLVLRAVAIWAACSACPARAQELNPRAYVITPVGTNAVNIAYSHLEGGVLLDGSVPITDARASINLSALGYYRSLDFFGRSANVAIGIPYGYGHFEGTVVEVPKRVDRSGLLDSYVRFSVNLFGGPALQAAQFAHWTQQVLLGVSLKIVPPTGQYDPTVLINWGSNRWAFKPELGYSQRFGHWLIDAYAGMWFFTDNNEFFSHNQFFPGTRTMSQSPVAAFESHLSYDVRPRLWISLDANFWSGGESTVNGVNNPQSYQRNSRVGVTASVPLTARQSVRLSYSDGAYIRYGGNYRSISLAWQYGWIGH